MSLIKQVVVYHIKEDKLLNDFFFFNFTSYPDTCLLVNGLWDQRIESLGKENYCFNMQNWTSERTSEVCDGKKKKEKKKMQQE